MTLRAAIAVAATTLLLVPSAFASGTATPNEIGLAKALKGEMQKYFNKKVPGTKLTVVTCKIDSGMSSAKCVAHFTRANLKGIYQVAVAADAAGNSNWGVTSAVCTNVKTGARVKPCK
jgi:phage tail tape-measure protein